MPDCPICNRGGGPSQAQELLGYCLKRWRRSSGKLNRLKQENKEAGRDFMAGGLGLAMSVVKWKMRSEALEALITNQRKEHTNDA